MNNNFNSILTQQKLLNIYPRMSNDSSLSSLNSSDFPNLNSQNQSSFNLQQMQQLQNQLRNSSFQSGALSAPILDSQTNLWFNLSSSIPGNNYNIDTTSNMLMLMKKNYFSALMCPNFLNKEF
ncbi:hypothetical protein BpHYR1_009256 [Brachionus plicatilis]|uniref:Uncharacterized protein n=1 Tax=Brachionus plicatilis TaxID=10195 RepID=A0A3M7PGI3_BRAPC|nr:hypothetical protein BpHYR1_009256 [Brachionus plicatilis]